MTVSTHGLQPLNLRLLLGSLAGVYTIQSLVGTFTLQGIPAVLRAEGVSTHQIGLFYLAMLPWALKFLWSPQVERYRKQRPDLRNHSLLITGSQWSIVLIMALFLTPLLYSTLAALFACVLAMALLSSVADISADGLAVDQLSERQHSLGNMMQVGGSYLGAMLGSGVFIYLSGTSGWHSAISVLMVAVLLMSLPALQLRKRQGRVSSNDIPQAPSLRRAFRNPIIRRGMLWILICQIGTRLTLAMLMPFMVDQQIELADLGLLAAGGWCADESAGCITERPAATQNQTHHRADAGATL